MKQVFAANRPHQPTVEWSDHIDVRVLAANTAEQHSVPAGARFVVFSATGDFYAKPDGGAIAVPSADVADGSAPELNPLSRSVESVTNISLIAPAACTVTLAFYA